MRRVFRVAVRELIATVATKGFLIGLVLTPLIVLVTVVGMRLMLDERAPRIEGEIAIIDPTGRVAAGLREYLSPEAMAARQAERMEQLAEQVPEGLQLGSGPGGLAEAQRQAVAAVQDEVPQLEVVELDNAGSLAAAKEQLHQTIPGMLQRLALVIVHDDAVSKPEGQDRYGGYDLFIREKLDDRIGDEIRRGMREAIVDTRIRLAGHDRDTIEALTKVEWVRAVTVTKKGEKETNEVVTMLLPAGFLMLLFVSVMSGGQGLLTTTVEEKSSRVVEVLLSAVSPMQLMTGKIIGQMLVGFIILGVYAAMGTSVLLAFAMLGLLDPWLLVYLLIFYLIAYFLVASLMGAVGAAVNQMREAQSLMAPIMMTLMIPWLLWLPISRDPGSTFSVITSFLPPISPFVMLIRLSSSTPPPLWQVWLSILIGVLAVIAAIWFAAKVFRIGLLMYGKPPSFKTLAQWVRMA